MQEHEIAPPPRFPNANATTPTATQQAVQRLTASIQAETTLGIAARLDDFVGGKSDEIRGGVMIVPVEALADFYSALVREGEALRRVASGA